MWAFHAQVHLYFHESIVSMAICLFVACQPSLMIMHHQVKVEHKWIEEETRDKWQARVLGDV